MHLFQKYYQNNNTFQELVNSGNLGIITDNKIKNGLLDLELLYKKMKSSEDHMRFDFEGYVFATFFDAVDIDPFTENYAFIASGGKAGSRAELSRAAIEKLLGDVRYKNGFTLSVYMHTQINGELEEIRAKSQDLVTRIEAELAKRN